MNEQPRKTTFSGHSDCIYALASGPKPGDFFSAGADGMVVLWNVNQPNEGRLIAKTTNSMYCLKYIEETNQILIGVNLDGLHLIDLEDGKEVWTYSTPTQNWFRMAEMGQKIVVAGSHGQLLIFDTISNAISKVQLGTHDLRALDVDYGTQRILVGTSDTKVIIYKNGSDHNQTKFFAHQNTVFSVRFYPYSNTIVSVGRDAKMKKWNETEEGKFELEKEIPAHLFGIHDVVIHPTKPILATCSMDKTIKIWDAESLKLLRVLDKTRHAGHGHSINQLLWLPKQELLLSCSDDRTITAWDIFA